MRKVRRYRLAKLLNGRAFRAREALRLPGGRSTYSGLRSGRESLCSTKNKSFEDFSVRGPDNPIAQRELTTVSLAVRNFMRNFPNENRPGLLLIGDPGSGKTHLAIAAMRKIIEKGFECLFFDYQNLLDRIRSGYDPSSTASNKEAYRVALDAEVLMLDDLGAHRVTDWVEDTITSIITQKVQQPEAADADYKSSGRRCGKFVDR